MGTKNRGSTLSSIGLEFQKFLMFWNVGNVRSPKTQKKIWGSRSPKNFYQADPQPRGFSAGYLGTPGNGAPKGPKGRKIHILLCNPRCCHIMPIATRQEHGGRIHQHIHGFIVTKREKMRLIQLCPQYSPRDM